MSTKPINHPLATLPTELFLQITAPLPRSALSALSRTCHALHDRLAPTLSTLFRADASDILIWSIRHNKHSILRRAMATNIPIPLFVEGDSLLCWGITVAHRDTVRVLLEYRVGPNFINPQGVTPLLSAIYRRDAGLVRALLEAGANPNTMHHYHSHTSTPLALAMKYGERSSGEEIARVLKEYGATAEHHDRDPRRDQP